MNNQDKSIADYFEAMQLMRKHFSKKLCMVPSNMQGACSSKKVKCHTISKKAALDRISVNGHVYTLACDGERFCKMIGVNKATVFYGFCKKHDSEIFLPIENVKEIETKKQTFLLAYRALCLRLYKKKASKKTYEECNQFSPLFDPDDLNAAINDLEHFKLQYDKMLCSNQYDNFSTLLIKLENFPLVMGTGFICPEIDINGNFVNNMYDPSTKLKGFAISCISPPGSDAGVIALSATKDSSELLQTYCSYLYEKDGNEILEIIVKLLFLYEENIVFNIPWWDDLPKSEHELFYDLFFTYTSPLNTNDDVKKSFNFLRAKHGLFKDYNNVSIKMI